jgi:hypothetical protein
MAAVTPIDIVTPCKHFPGGTLPFPLLKRHQRMNAGQIHYACAATTTLLLCGPTQGDDVVQLMRVKASGTGHNRNNGPWRDYADVAESTLTDG